MYAIVTFCGASYDVSGAVVTGIMMRKFEQLKTLITRFTNGSSGGSSLEQVRVVGACGDDVPRQPLTGVS